MPLTQSGSNATVTARSYYDTTDASVHCNTVINVIGRLEDTLCLLYFTYYLYSYEWREC